MMAWIENKGRSEACSLWSVGFGKGRLEEEGLVGPIHPSDG